MQEVKALFGVCLFFLINQTNYFVCGFSCSFKKENLIKFVMCCRCTSRMKNASVLSHLLLPRKRIWHYDCRHWSGTAVSVGGFGC